MNRGWKTVTIRSTTTIGGPALAGKATAATVPNRPLYGDLLVQSSPRSKTPRPLILASGLHGIFY